jgi:hypothetical protein
MQIVIDTSEPLNGTDYAVLAAILERIPHPDIPSPGRSTRPEDAQGHAPIHGSPALARNGTTPPPGARPTFDPANPIPSFSARAQIANQPGVTITPTRTDAEPTSDDTTPTHTDDTQHQG